MAQVIRATDPPRLLDVALADCVIEGALDLGGVEFVDGAEFQGAVFEGPVSFVNASFIQGVGFNEATFERGVTFDSAHFQQEAFFQRITVRQRAGTFRGAQFDSLALFTNALFAGDASFTRATFGAGGSFGHAAFGADVDFDSVTGAVMDFARSRFTGHLASFSRFTAEQLRLTRAVCAAQVEAEVAADVIALTGAVFSAGVSIRCAPRAGGNSPRLVLDEARFGASSFIAGNGPPAPVLESMRYADASELTLSDVALATCRFQGTHNLDRLRLEGSAFVASPPGWRFVSPWPWPQRWTPRRVLAEEVAWRVQQPTRRPEWGPAPEQPAPALKPDEIAALYRALRKGREDHKDEPGAADFYYGEMEMRRWGARRGAHASRLDRFVLSTYWLTSGYALRASRAFTTLLVVIVVFALLFGTVGFAAQAVSPRAIGVENGRIVYADTTLPERGPVDEAFRALTYSAATATAVAGAPARRLTHAGEVLRIMLRVLGPVLLALTAVSIRGRIKR